MKQTIYDNKILIVDDSQELRSMLRTFLLREGYRNIALAVDCKSALSEIRSSRNIPVLFLSARDKDADRLTGLGLGADDYMVKPFLPKELSLRMGAILKRSYDYAEEPPLPATLELGERRVDFEAGTVQSGDREEKLTVKELRILETLAKSRGKIVTFDNLCKAVWNAQYYTYENTVMVHIRRLREKIEEDPSHPRWLVTARGIGYKLNL